MWQGLTCARVLWGLVRPCRHPDGRAATGFKPPPKSLPNRSHTTIKCGRVGHLWLGSAGPHEPLQAHCSIQAPKAPPQDAHPGRPAVACRACCTRRAHSGQRSLPSVGIGPRSCLWQAALHPGSWRQHDVWTPAALLAWHLCAGCSGTGSTCWAALRWELLGHCCGAGHSHRLLPRLLCCNLSVLATARCAVRLMSQECVYNWDRLHAHARNTGRACRAVRPGCRSRGSGKRHAPAARAAASPGRAAPSGARDCSAAERVSQPSLREWFDGLAPQGPCGHDHAWLTGGLLARLAGAQAGATGWQQRRSTRRPGSSVVSLPAREGALPQWCLAPPAQGWPHRQPCLAAFSQSAMAAAPCPPAWPVPAFARSQVEATSQAQGRPSTLPALAGRSGKAGHWHSI